MPAKLKTTLVVVMLSCLIWVFAERSVTQSDTVQVDIELVNMREDLLVQYLGQHDEALKEKRQTVKLTVEGPARRIQAVREKQLNITVPLNVQELEYDAQDNGPQDYLVRVVKDILDGHLRLRDMNLTVTDAEPELLRVRVRKLLKQPIQIKVYDQLSGAELSRARVDPETVDAYVIKGQSAEAKIILSAEQQTQAAAGPLTVGSVILPYGTKNLQVQVVLPKGVSPYPVAAIKVPRWGVLMPPAMLGKYRVVIENTTLLKEPITCRGTTQAVAEYRNSPYHLVLEIRESDEIGPAINRSLHYYLPEGYGQIEVVDRVQGTIRFHLESAETGAGSPADTAE